MITSSHFFKKTFFIPDNQFQDWSKQNNQTIQSPTKSNKSKINQHYKLVKSKKTFLISKQDPSEFQFTQRFRLPKINYSLGQQKNTLYHIYKQNQKNLVRSKQKNKSQAKCQNTLINQYKTQNSRDQFKLQNEMNSHKIMNVKKITKRYNKIINNVDDKININGKQVFLANPSSKQWISGQKYIKIRNLSIDYDAQRHRSNRNKIDELKAYQRMKDMRFRQS